MVEMLRGASLAMSSHSWTPGATWKRTAHRLSGRLAAYIDVHRRVRASGCASLDCLTARLPALRLREVVRPPSLKAKAKLALAKPRQPRGRAHRHNNGGVFARSTPRPSFEIGDGQPPDFQVDLGIAVELFNEGNYYQAHDVLEELWHHSSDPTRSALHGVLQCAVGLHHLLSHNHRGCMLEFGEGLRKLDRLQPTGSLVQFAEEAHDFLEFVYDTQVEFASCVEDQCELMEGTDEDYDKLGDFGRDKKLYVLEQVFHEGVLRKRMLFNPRLDVDPEILASLQAALVPNLAITWAELREL